MEDVHKFGTSIKKKYQERRINCEKQWPPCHSNKLVRLEIVEREKGEGYSSNTQRGKGDQGIKRSPLAYGDTFKEESGKRPVRKVLVEGDAGIGKTTLCVSVSEDWANGKLFQQFELVLLLPLRIKVVASAGSLPELLKLLHPSPRLCDSVARYLEEEEGESVLIIADGWDELSESERNEGSFLYQLFFEAFPMLSVVLTSRPSASAPLHQLPCIDRFAEVRGFSKEHIVEYIQSEFVSDQEKAGRLLEQLENNPLVESVCSVPLNCAIVCHLWRTLEEAFPTTMTELYTNIILLLILRNIRKIGIYSSILNLPNFDSLPLDLQQSWWLLCEFAFRALEKDQLIFSLEELEAFFPEGLASDKRILCFGLLQSAELIGCGRSFNFLHLTFQEYLAALHLARKAPDKQLDFFQCHKSGGLLSQNRFIVVKKFFFGINHFNASGVNADIIQQMFKCVAGESSPDILSLCHCAFEDHGSLISDQLTRYLISHFSSLGRIGIRFGFPRTAHDCSAVLFTLSNMQESDAVEINFNNCGVGENQIKKLLDILANKEGKLQITGLLLSGSRLTVSSLQALQSAVGGDLFAKLESLNLSSSLTSDAGFNAEWLTTFVDVLSAHCPLLSGLNLSDNNLGIPGASALARIFVTDCTLCREPSSDTCGLRNVYLNKANIGDKGLVILIKDLNVVSMLTLKGNNIHSFGISCLADAVHSGKLELYGYSKLHLSNNPLGLEGSLAVGTILSSSHCHCFNVELSACELTTAGAGLPNKDTVSVGYPTSSEAVTDIGQQLCLMPQNSILDWLVLDGNSFTGEGIHILAGFIHLCPCMAYLDTNDCGITSDDLIRLLDRLAQLKSSSPNLCSKLEAWYLQNNLIDDSGAAALIYHLPSLFPHLGRSGYSDVFLNNNPVSDEMAKRLEEELRRRREEIQSASLLFKSISGDSARSVTGTSTSKTIPPPLRSSTLALKDAFGLVPHTAHPEDHQQQQGSGSDVVLGASLDLSHPISELHEEDFTSLHCHDAVIEGCNEDTPLDLRPPLSKGHKEDFSSLPGVEHHFVDLIKWEDEKGVKSELRIYSKIAHRWRQIATRLGFEPGEIESVEENHRRNDSRITVVLGRWFENAMSLSNAGRYPKSWQGLMNLLEDAELSEVAGEMKKALSSPKNSLRGNLS